MFRRLVFWFGLLVVVLVTGLGWFLSAGIAPVLVTAGVGLITVVIFSMFLTRRFRRPTRDLVEAFSRMGTGSVGPRMVAEGDPVVKVLAESFNRTSESISTRIAELEEDRQQLRTILSSMVEGVVALDADQRILYANDRASQLLELPSPTPVGRPLWEVVRHRPLLDAVRNAEQGADPHREECTWSGQSTRSLTVHAARLPGTPSKGTVLVLHDTTELRRLERLRQEFVANVSHELKTPLSVIKVCVETLMDGAMDDAEHRGRFLEQISRQADRLHALILDLLSLARIESGAQMFDLRAVSIEAAVRSCVERHRPRAEARGQQLDCEFGGEGLRAWADEEAVDQILENLLDNALKYTPEGGEIAVQWLRQGEQVCFEVTDTGIGIPEADIPRIFERFYRVDRARSREMGGTGLGLSIVKHLTQAMNGVVTAKSQLGKGTTFRVCLPRAP